MLTEADLKHINNAAVTDTVMAWKSQYKRNTHNPFHQLLNSSNAVIKFAVNPYPNENDALGILGVERDSSIKTDPVYPVQGQLVRTGYKISHLLPHDQTRIAGEVYHPDGTVLEQAKAFIVTNENIEQYKKQLGIDNLHVGEILFQMPQGALQDKNSVFNQDKFRGIQNLKVRMYARPRTQEEFKEALPQPYMVVPGKDPASPDEGETPTYYLESNAVYTPTGAGTAVINHNGTNVLIDKQGIDRYDHYNVLGDFLINLDDTRYYNQTFDRKLEGSDLATKLKPGETKALSIILPSAHNEFDKTADQMNAYEKKHKVKAEINEEFIKRFVDAGWKIQLNDADISTITVTAPEDAKPGDFISVPLRYTYTNGSVDDHWFSFVVRDSMHNKPEYYAKNGLPGTALTSNPLVASDPKKAAPISYELGKGKTGVVGTYTDDAGNVWNNVSLDPKTGAVSATVPEGVDIKGGETLFVPVKVKFADGTFEVVKAQFIARPLYKAEVIHEYDKDVPFEAKEELDETLPAGTIKVVTPGTVGKKHVVFKQVVHNDTKGTLVNGIFVPGNEKFLLEEKVVRDKQDRLVKVGVRPTEEQVNVGRPVEIVQDDTLAAGTQVVDQEGQDGVITFKKSYDPKTGSVTMTKTETTKVVPKKIRIGSKPFVGSYKFKNTCPVLFSVIVRENPNLVAGTSRVAQAGVAGSKETVYTQALKNGAAVGAPTSVDGVYVAPIPQIIEVGTKLPETRSSSVVPNPSPDTTRDATPTTKPDATPTTKLDAKPVKLTQTKFLSSVPAQSRLPQTSDGSVSSEAIFSLASMGLAALGVASQKKKEHNK